MRIVAVDDEELMLDRIGKIIGELQPHAQFHTFQNPRKAYEFAKTKAVDVFFLDICMAGIDGITLAKSIKLLQPRTNIIFTTGFSEYMPDAFLLNASGYLLKPVTVKQVREQLNVLRFPVSALSSKKVRLQCFGNFEIFSIDNRPIRFRHSKTKEVLAYLAFRRGTTCTNGEIIATLWEDDSHDSYFRDLRKDLIDTLKEYECSDILETSRGRMALVVDKVDCDYFDWLHGTAVGINAYHGEFMTQYSWAEFYNASIQSFLQGDQSG